MLSSTGVPIGLFCDSRYTSHEVEFGRGDSLVLYTDGLTDAATAAGQDYGEGRLAEVLRRGHGFGPRQTIHSVLSDLDSFIGGNPKSDDLTVMVLRRS